MSEGFQAAQREMYAKQAKEVDIIITTALIPGKPAPKLITAEMVQEHEARQRDRRHGRRAGRQLRADRARRGRGAPWRDHHRLHRLASRLAKQSSTLYATNLLRLTEELCKAKDGVAVVNMEDDAIRGLTVVKDGAITWPAPPLKLQAPAPAPKAAAPVVEKNRAMATARARPCPPRR
jgi:NAD(P) transhydrogenase subunit alpha